MSMLILWKLGYKKRSVESQSLHCRLLISLNVCLFLNQSYAKPFMSSSSISSDIFLSYIKDVLDLERPSTFAILSRVSVVRFLEEVIPYIKASEVGKQLAF